MHNLKASLPVIRRLPRYYRYINELQEAGAQRVSSSQLAVIMGSTPSQVRQDFNCFGGFGQQGIGYSVELLQSEIEHLLFPHSHITAILVGAGSLGATIANFVIRDAQGVELIGVFDSSDELVGKPLQSLTIKSDAEILPFCKEHHPDLAIVCIPKDAAEKFAPTIEELGVKGIWNYSHYDFNVYNKALIVENVHLRDSLMALSYRISHKDDE